MKKDKNQKIDIYALERDYLNSSANEKLFSNNLNNYILKKVIQNLEPYERRLLILYVELGSYRKAAQYTGLGRNSYHLTIKSIKEKVIKEYRKYVDKYN